MKKVQKGQYGYISYQKKVTILRTVVLFTISFAILIVGRYYTGTTSNLMTIIAILGMLPASKSAVNMIMFLRFKDGDRDKYQETLRSAEGLPMNFDLVFTMPDKSVMAQQAVVGQGSVSIYQNTDNTNVKKVQEHIRSMLDNNQMKHIEVKVWNDFDAYMRRVKEIQEKYTSDQDEQGQAVLALLQAIAL